MLITRRVQQIVLQKFERLSCGWCCNSENRKAWPMRRCDKTFFWEDRKNQAHQLHENLVVLIFLIFFTIMGTGIKDWITIDLPLYWKHMCGGVTTITFKDVWWRSWLEWVQRYQWQPGKTDGYSFLGATLTDTFTSLIKGIGIASGGSVREIIDSANSSCFSYKTTALCS